LRLQKYNVFFEPPNFFPYFFNFISSYLFFRTFRTGYRDTLNRLSGHFEQVIRTLWTGHPDWLSGSSGRSVRAIGTKCPTPSGQSVRTPFGQANSVLMLHS